MGLRKEKHRIVNHKRKRDGCRWEGGKKEERIKIRKWKKEGKKRDISISVRYEEYIKIKLSTDCYT